MSVALPTLPTVRCPPYKGNVTLAACVDRHRRANGAKPPASSTKGLGRGTKAVRAAQVRNALVGCVGCPLGAERADGA